MAAHTAAHLVPRYQGSNHQLGLQFPKEGALHDTSLIRSILEEVTSTVLCAAADRWPHITAASLAAVVLFV